jgi:hypothetical protein
MGPHQDGGGKQDPRGRVTGKRCIAGPVYLAVVAALAMPGCVSPVAMHQAVLAYDRSVERVTSEELLLNIVRARFYQPVHFTKVSSVAATFDFRVTVGITPPAGDSRSLVAPMFSATVAENPTVTIVPIDGEEFTTRLLTPLDEGRFLKLLEVGADLGMALRMVAGSLRVDTVDNMRVYMNDPGRTKEYEEFRRRINHLARLHHAHLLHIDPVMSEEVWTGTLATGVGPQDVLAALDKGYKWKRLADDRTYRLNRMRVLISNYRPHEVTEQVRRELVERLREWPPNDILVDIREGFPGGEEPLTGQITLRSFNSVLEFLARTVQEPSNAIGDVEHRPNGFEASRVLTIEESDRPPDQAAVTVQYGDRYFSIRRPDEGDPSSVMNIKAFGMLYQLFQMMVQPVAAQVPGIAIAK